MSQLTNQVIMIRPANFGSNPETAENNTFQSTEYDRSEAEVSELARQEFDAFVSVLEDHGIEVLVIEDSTDPVKPDAVFPNNWFSTHRDGSIITYPMYSPLRRNERRDEILSVLHERHPGSRRYAFEQYEEQEQYLEGTGSMVLDRENKVVYACISDRTNIMVLDKWCVLRGYSKIAFHAFSDGVAIYHTNVVMAMGDDFVVMCMEAVPSAAERAELLESFESTGKELIEITTAQMNAFAGNMLQLATPDSDSILVMSQAAYESLSSAQKMRLGAFSKIVVGAIPTIEKYGGGSVRCMIAENFLD